MVVRPPALLPGLGLALISAPFAFGVFLPPAHQRHQFLAHVAADGAAGQQVLGAVGFGGLGQDDGAAMAHQQVAGRTQGGVGGDAGIAVRAAALQRHGQFAGGDGFAVHGVGIGQGFAHEGDAGLDGFAGAAHVLDVHAAQAAGEALFGQHSADLVHFAAQPEHDHRGEIDVPGVAAEGAAQHPQRLVLGHAAAGLVGEGDDAVHVGEIGQRVVTGERVLLEDVGDHAGHMGTAVHAGQDADIVARGGPAVGTADAFEGRGQVEIRGRLGVDAPGIVLGEIAHAAIMFVHMLAGGDGGGGEADDLAVAADCLAGFHRADGHFVAGGNAFGGGDARRQFGAGLKRGSRDQNPILEGVGGLPWMGSWDASLFRLCLWSLCGSGQCRSLRRTPSAPRRSGHR